MARRILFLSSPVAPIGAGEGGGVDTTLRQLAPALVRRGHTVAIIGPEGSVLPEGPALYPVAGSHPANATTAPRDFPVSVASDGVLENMWRSAQRLQKSYDVIVGMTYDWLSYYLTPFFCTRLVHWVTITSTIEAVDRELARGYRERPGDFAFYSRAQASTFPFVDGRSARIIPGAVDLERFAFHEHASPALVWAARISPEKGLEDAVRVAKRLGISLHVCGKIQDESYWQAVQRSAGPGVIVYHGFLPHDRLCQILGTAMAMLVTPKWVEAFGFTVVEALACGTPVVAYDQGGPAEIVEDGRSGYLVPPGDLDAMVEAVRRIHALRRSDARLRAEEYSVDRLVGRVEDWLEMVLGHALK